MLNAPSKLAESSHVLAFLNILMSRAVKSLSPDTIRPVYQVLSGVSSMFLDDLPLSVVTHFQDQATELLNAKDSQSLHLCMAVLAIFASRPRVSREGESEIQQDKLQPHGDLAHSAQTDRYAPARKIFVNKRARKSLDLAVMRAIVACFFDNKPAIHANLQTNIEALELAGKIIEVIEVDEKRSWMAKNVARVNKLLEKIVQAGIDPSLQCAVKSAMGHWQLHSLISL